MNFTEYYLTEETNSYTIPSTIKDNFKIVGGLDNFKCWKTKVLAANSAGPDVKKGDWEEPMYVMISLDSNNIIPIANSDSHQVGYDLLEYYYFKKKLIQRENYVSICGDSTTYVYDDPKDTENKLKAFQKWLSYGGENQPVCSMGGSYRGDMLDIIERKGNVKIIPGKLAKGGKDIIDSIEHIAKEYLKFSSLKNGRTPNDDEVHKLFEFTKQFLDKFLKSGGYNRELTYIDLPKNQIVNDDYIRSTIKRVLEDEDKLDWDDLAQIFLSHTGIKNRIHMGLRHIIQSKKVDNDWEGLFGDIELANKEFNRIGALK